MNKTITNRDKTIALISLLCPILLLIFIGKVNTTYAAEGRGLILNVLGKSTNGKDIIEINNYKTYPTTGKLFMTSVGVYSKTNFLESLDLWLNDASILPRSFLFPPQQSVNDINKQDEKDFKKSEDFAVTSAMNYLELNNKDININIGIKNVGGPSAGLIFALGIVDKLTPFNLVGNLNLAGTGEIDKNGNVLPIGGIIQKMFGAKAAGADVFLVPDKNCSEALTDIPKGLKIISVNSLSDAISQIQKFKKGQNVTTCKS